MSPDEIRALCENISDSAVSKAMLSTASENGRRDAMLETILSEIKIIREQVPMFTEAKISMVNITAQLQRLEKKGEETAEKAIKDAVSAAKSVVHDEIIQAAKDTKYHWRSVIPTAISVIISSGVCALITYFLVKP